MSARDNLGPHLLGRKPSSPDSRDYPLSAFLHPEAHSASDPLDQALADVLSSWEGKKEKTLFKLLVDRVKSVSPSPPEPVPPGPNPAPAPGPAPGPPPVPAGDKSWDDTDATLDQGQTPHCVGFSCAQWGNTLPVDDHFTNSDGDALYGECKVIDGEPGQENGSSVRSGAKALQQRGRLSAYAFAANIDEVRQFVQQHGPVMFGTNWTNDMFTVDAKGFVHPTGGVAGGHAYVCVGDWPSESALLFHNSWGDGWGYHGLFKMTYDEAAQLFAQQGEACAAVELA